MFERIVVGTDGSPGAIDALHRTGELAQAVGAAEVHVVTASPPLPAYVVERVRDELPDEFRNVFDGHLPANEQIDEATSILSEYGVLPTIHDLSDDPATAILDTAAGADADLIVVGARGLGAVQRFLRGSVSTKVAHHAACDVLIVEHG
jgi:nucleotide-binding universal stress UspA family protein